jgi:hypothetical protein
MDSIDERKKITLEGTNNRYQIKKLVDNPTTPKLRKEVQRWNADASIYSEEYQKVLLEDLKTFSPSLENWSVIAKREIDKKIQSYKQQDLKKKRFSPVEFIDFRTICEELHKSKMQCHYCKESVFLLYENSREKMQWTLDRINNDLGHNQNNVLISCLSCNLKRRKTNKDAFVFTKNLKIIRTVEEN